MRDYLIEHGMKYDETIGNKVTARKDGKTYGFSEHLDTFVISALVYEIVKTLTDYKSKYKLRNMGETLCWEYQRSISEMYGMPGKELLSQKVNREKKV